jgi:hypothetical protein
VIARLLFIVITLGIGSRAEEAVPVVSKVEERNLALAIEDFPGETHLALNGHPRPRVKIEWLLGQDLSPVFEGTDAGPNPKAVARVKVGRTTITRTVLASADEGLVFIHLLADMPGALAFRASWTADSEDKLEVIDRRQLYWRDANAEPTDSARLWVLPFESEVEPSPAGILLRGEGEALLVIGWEPSSAGTKRIAELGRKFAPGEVPPNPRLIWRGVSGEK